MGRNTVSKVKTAQVPRKLMSPVIRVDESIIHVTYPKRSWGVDDYFQIEVRADASLTIRGHNGRLAVRPEVANLITVKLEDF